jgi:ketosteroid isomerase-like protein
MSARFSTPEQAEAAFYAAFEQADLGAMMAVWAKDEEVICVHPGRQRLVGIEAVRNSWRQIFAAGPQLRFQLLEVQAHTSRMIAIHTLYERVTVRGERGPAHLLLATNIYVLTSQGWSLLLHHASPLAAPAAAPEGPTGTVH